MTPQKKVIIHSHCRTYKIQLRGVCFSYDTWFQLPYLKNMLICSSKLDHFPQQIRGEHRICLLKTTTYHLKNISQIGNLPQFEVNKKYLKPPTIFFWKNKTLEHKWDQGISRRTSLNLTQRSTLGPTSCSVVDRIRKAHP